MKKILQLQLYNFIFNPRKDSLSYIDKVKFFPMTYYHKNRRKNYWKYILSKTNPIV